MKAQAFTTDLNQWLPRLIELWRQHRSSRPSARAQKRPLFSPLLPIEKQKIIQGIRMLSEGLTRTRSLAGEEYFSDTRILGAYLLYFWPISYLQARYVLETLPKVPLSLLELGAGAGPLGAAACDIGVKHVTFADRNRLVLNLAQELFHMVKKQPLLHLWDPLRKPALPSGPFDLIGLQHVLNELWVHESDRVARRLKLLQMVSRHLKPKGQLLLIEPALTSTSRELLQIRDQLLSLGMTLVSPCLWDKACPALDKPEDTCHSEYLETLPPLLRTFIQQSHFLKRSLKMTFMVFSLSQDTATGWHHPEIFRIVSEPLISKNHRIRLLGCGRSGRLSLALKPTAITPQNHIFPNLHRGDVIRITGALSRSGGLDIMPATNIELIHKANH